MIFWVAMPVLLAAFGNFLIPLMIGCDDMVFPRVNRLSYQIFLLSAIVLVASFFVPGGAFGGAWTAYPPLSANGAYNLTPYGVDAVARRRRARVRRVPARRHQLRHDGDELARAGHEDVRRADRRLDDRARERALHGLGRPAHRRRRHAAVRPDASAPASTIPARGGDPILWQHLFWFFGHPEVYVVLLPAMGIVADVMAVFARKKLFAYRTIIYTAVATGVISFFVWAHHQFVAGIDPRMANLFTITTLIISVPIAEMVFVYIATLYGGSITLDDADAVGAVVRRRVPARRRDGHLPRRGRRGHLLPRHLLRRRALPLHVLPDRVHRRVCGHHVLVPEDVRPDDERTLGKIHFWGTIIAFNVIFIPLFITGAAGDHRRIYDYSQLRGSEPAVAAAPARHGDDGPRS